MKKVGKFYITTPIYYINDQPHIGHAYATIAADILARHKRQQGDEVFFLTGTDEHGVKISKAAKNAGMDEKKFSDRISRMFVNSWAKLEILSDDFIRTTESRHEKVVKEFFDHLKDAKTSKGRAAIYEGEYAGLYCEGCEAYKTPLELKDGLCPEHKVKPVGLKEKNWFFRLSDYQDYLKKQIGFKKLIILPKSRQSEVLGFLKQGLKDIPISRAKVDWGIKLPFDREQTAYVWIDALLNYLSALGWPDDKKFKKFWPADLQIIGKDILKFHAIIWPAMLAILKIDLPKVIFAHGFFTVAGEKMSKSLGNVIAPNDLVKQYGPDATRYVLESLYPFGQDGDISLEKIAAKYKSALANGLGNLVSRVLNLIEQEYGGKIPLTTASPRDLSKINKLYDEYKIQEAILATEEAVMFANQYIDKHKLWQLVKTKKEEAGVILSGLCALLGEIAKSLAPVMPNISKEILNRLSADKIIKGKPLFKAV